MTDQVQDPVTPEWKDCVYCSSKIRANAIVCRFCNRELPAEGAGVVCTSCGEANEGDGAYCEFCGTALPLPAAASVTAPIPTSASCPQCGAATTEELRFCEQCGFSLQQAQTPAGPPQAQTPPPVQPATAAPTSWPPPTTAQPPRPAQPLAGDHYAYTDFKETWKFAMQLALRGGPLALGLSAAILGGSWLLFWLFLKASPFLGFLALPGVLVACALGVLAVLRVYVGVLDPAVETTFATVIEWSLPRALSATYPFVLLLSISLGAFLPTLLFTVIAGFAGGNAMAWLTLLIAAGIMMFLVSRFWMWGPAFVIDGKRGVDAIGRSEALTRGSWLSLAIVGSSLPFVLILEYGMTKAPSILWIIPNVLEMLLLVALSFSTYLLLRARSGETELASVRAAIGTPPAEQQEA